jgi:hypothetical protein
MHCRTARWLGLAALAGGMLLRLSLGHSQPAASDPAPPATPQAAKNPRDLASMSPLQRQMYLSAQRGADWLFRANRPDGRFVYGLVPALNAPLEGDHYLRQAGAAAALARAARFFGEERYAARARQAILVLLMDTVVDPDQPTVRYTALPSVVINRLASAGLLVSAIHELPQPGKDLLDQAEQLCEYIRRQQQSDGSLRYCDPVASGAGSTAALSDPEGINYYPGEALYGLMLSQRHRPADWKTDVVRKAVGYYHPWWKANANMAFVPWQTAACTEAYLRTKEPVFADFVNEMNDWLCELQYARLDPRQPLWLGGFMGWAEGKAVAAPPQVGSASYAESLAEACRVARQAGDLPRYQRYRSALESCLQFLSTLQYTDANAQHFAAWYRPAVLGAFFASHQDGNLRIDYTQHPVNALVNYLAHVAD